MTTDVAIKYGQPSDTYGTMDLYKSIVFLGETKGPIYDNDKKEEPSWY